MNNTYTTSINGMDNLSTVRIVPETGEIIENTENTGEKTNVTPPEANQIKKIFFDPRSWKPAKDVNSTVATRSFISNPFGNGLIEAYTVGDWNWNWSVIETKDMTLDKNTDYELIFWLNGGENEQGNETCKLEIVFDNDYENRYTYNLNRDFIHYEKHYKGWYLYRIPFNTGDACYTKLQFAAMRAYASLVKTVELESYGGLSEDLPPVGVPQRHNIIFKDGFPANASWSYKIFGKETLHTPGNSTHMHFNFSDENKNNHNERKFFHENYEAMEDDIESSLEGLLENVKAQLAEQLDDVVVANDVAHVINMNVDVDSIKEQIIQNIKENLNF